MAFAREVSFDGVTRERNGELQRQIDEGERPDDIPASEFVVLYDPDEQSSLAILFFDSEEDYADEYVGQRIQPFRIEQEARKLEGTNFVVNSRFKPFAVRDGHLITGQQQYSGGAAAKLVIEALGI